MSRDQRVADNHALLAAQQDALERENPLVVVVRIYLSVANRRQQHYRFMLNGLQQVEQRLSDLNVDLLLTTDDLKDALAALDPAAVYFDFSPLRGPQAVRKRVARAATCPVYEVDTHNVVPVWLTSGKQEYAARTIRPKIHRYLGDYLVEPEPLEHHPYRLGPGPVNDWTTLASRIVAANPDAYTPPFESGEDAASVTLENFIQERLANYDGARNDPTLDGQSGLSPYLHFGHISSLRAVMAVRQVARERQSDERVQTSANAFIEQVVVRKELADNFCYYNRNYDNWNGLPDWGKTTLHEHRNDPREFLYTLEEFEAAATHDDAWNAAQIEMLRTGKMHNYMRMYWAKKILEWTPAPDTAIEIAITLNDRYELDGYDPNGYANILWSIGGLHDRPWQERPVYGKVRYMNFNGLKRKFDVQAYVERWG